MNAIRILALTVCMVLLALPFNRARAAEGHEHGQHQHTAPAADDEHAQHHQHQPAAAAKSNESIALKLPDTPLTDQDGRKLRLVSELMGDRIIVASFVYTNCTTICPVVSTLFSQTQDKLGDLLERKVRLVSLSVDPARDTPARLKAYAATHGAKPGWYWLTGAPADVTAALQGFGTYTPNFKDHPVVIMIGDAKSGKWIRYYGFQNPDRLAAKVREVLAARDLAPLATVQGDH